MKPWQRLPDEKLPNPPAYDPAVETLDDIDARDEALGKKLFDLAHEDNFVLAMIACTALRTPELRAMWETEATSLAQSVRRYQTPYLRDYLESLGIQL